VTCVPDPILIYDYRAVLFGKFYPTTIYISNFFDFSKFGTLESSCSVVGHHDGDSEKSKILDAKEMTRIDYSSARAMHTIFCIPIHKTVSIGKNHIV